MSRFISHNGLVSTGRVRRVPKSAFHSVWRSPRGWLSLPGRVHQDERGAISVLSVFALLVFTFLLVMVVNVATHLDDKVRMQNSADAAAHSGGVVLARGMNAVAFSNHLLCDMFALTAYLRESRDRESEKFIPEILAEWQTAAQRHYSASDFQKFQTLGNALQQKIPLEQELVSAFGELNAASAQFTLPVFESALEQKLIPQFQQTLIRTVPQIAQQASMQVAVLNGLRPSELNQYPNLPPLAANARSRQSAVLWRLRGDQNPYPDENDPYLRTSPVVDPTPSNSDFGALQNSTEYAAQALEQRQEISKFYLEQWTSETMVVFDEEANLSQYNWLWRIFTAGQLDKLLKEDYPDSNLPMVSRLPRPQVPLLQMQWQGMQSDVNQNIDDDYHFLAGVYRQHVVENGPGLFRNPLKSNTDAMSFTQLRLFLPRPRFYFGIAPPPQDPRRGTGGGFGFRSSLPLPGGGPGSWTVWADNWPAHHWDCFNQNWTVQLVPATSDVILPILTSDPTPCQCTFNRPELGNLTMPMIRQINTH